MSQSKKQEPTTARTRRQRIVVGDKFRDFAERFDSVLTFSEFRLQGDQPDITYHIGQGMTEGQRMTVARANQTFSSTLVSAAPAAATRAEVHKHEPQNILVSIPERVGHDEYRLELLVDGRCEILSDHQTGLHLQGMVLSEASRQAFLAITERFFIPVGESGSQYFVSDKQEIDFQGFAFPLPTAIYFRILNSCLEKGRMKFDSQMEFVQAGRTVAAVDWKYSAREKGWLAAKEIELASEALDRFYAEEVTQLVDAITSYKEATL